MIDGTDLVSLELRTRDLIGEETAALWTQARVFRAISAEVMRLCRKAIGLDVGYFEQTYTTTPAASVTLPSNCYLVRNVELYQYGAWVQPRHITAHQAPQYQATGSSQPDAWRFSGGAVVLESGVGSASSMRIQYVRLPAEMRYEAAAAGAASTITFASTASPVNDIYNDDQIIILAGTSAGDVRTISDYVGSTKVATVSAAWTSTPDTTSYFSTLLPDPISRFPDVVALGAAMRLVGRRRDGELYGMLGDQYQSDLADMMNALSQRQTEQAQHGNYLPQYEDD